MNDQQQTAELEHFDTEVGQVARIRYSNGETFVTADWQGPQPAALDEAAFYNWVHEETGQSAVMVFGLPHSWN